MSRLQMMKSKGLGSVLAMYSRSSFFSAGKTMDEVLDGIVSNQPVSRNKEHTSKTKIRTLKATMKV